MAKTYYKPQPVAAQTQINWAEVGKDFSDMLAEDKRVKDEKKAAIDEDTRQQMKNLNSVELINGQAPSANEWWLNASGEITNAMQMANGLLKSGQLSITAYTKMMQNINDGTDGLIGVFDKFKNEYNLKKERMDCNDPEGVGCSQKLEYWAMEQLEAMGNFQNTAVVVNPDTGSFSVADLVEGKIVNDPNKVRSINSLQTMAASEYNLYDDKAATDGFVNGLKEFSQEFVIPGTGDDKTQIVSSSNRFGGSIDFNSLNDNSTRTTDNILFNAIVGGESSDYSTIYAGSKIQPPSDINTMTVSEVQNWQKKNAAAGSISSAAGRFQIITSTLNGLLKDGTISKDDIFNEETQDKAYNALLERRGYSKFKDDFVNSKSDEEKIKLSQDFQVKLAQEWASIPVPYAIKKGRDGKYPKVDLVAGDSYYKNVAGNKASGDPKEFTKMLMNLNPSGIPISTQELTAEQEVYLAAEDQFITRVMADPRHITSILTNSIGKDKDGNDYTFTNKEDREPWEILLKDGMVISTTEEQNEIVKEYLRNDVRGKQKVKRTVKFVDSEKGYDKYNPKPNDTSETPEEETIPQKTLLEYALETQPEYNIPNYVLDFDVADPEKGGYQTRKSAKFHLDNWIGKLPGMKDYKIVVKDENFIIKTPDGGQSVYIDFDVLEKADNKQQKIKEIYNNIREISVENSLNKDIVPIENLFLITQKARKKYKEAQAGTGGTRGLNADKRSQ